MIKTFIFILLVSLSSGVSASEFHSYFRCFTLHDKKSINIKYVNFFSTKDKADIGYVKYEKSDIAIPLVFVKDDEMLIDDRPSIYTIVWSEIIDGKVNGTYTVMSQGTRFFGFTYTNKKNKSVEFEENWDAYDEEKGDCIWK
ncbi:MAG: hypothetical protein LBI71_03175 [Enterobacteriaceae bacterium]|jgi:hypothetical protein|nr:hypothetical protein [Enterobacteriaceae bacterium]